MYESLAQGGLGIGLSSVVSCIGAASGSLMIRNSVKGFLFFFRRIRGGNDSESFCDSVVDSHSVGPRAKDSGWALIDRSDCEEEGRDEVEEPELGMLDGYSALTVLVVGMSEGESWPICWNCATRFPISTNHVVPASSYCSWKHN